MVEIPPSLLERLTQRQAVLVAGLRCSELCDAPGWEELAKRLCGWLDDEARRHEIEALIEGGRFAAAIAYLSKRVERDAVVEVLKDAYPARESLPATVASASAIPWRGVISTGFDGSWPAADGAPAFTAGDAAALAAHGGAFVLNLCGTTAAPETLRLGATELQAFGGALDALRVLARRRSFVFVGFRAGDPDLALVMRALDGTGGPHFLFAEAAGLEAELLGDELGVTIVTCPGGRAGVEASLSALAEAWRSVEAAARPADDDVAGWLELLRRDPTDAEARAGLGRAEASLRAERRWDDLVELLLGRVEVVPERDEQLSTLREVARLYAEELDAPDRAFAALQAALRRDPRSDDLRAAAERTAGAAGLWGELAADYAEFVEELARDRGDAAAVPLRLALARVQAEELNQLSDAVVEYEAVLAADPKSEVAARALVELFGRQERWGELAAALARAAELEGDGPRAVELRLELADVQASRLSDTAAALATYEAVLAANPEQEEARDGALKLARRAERWDDVARWLDEKAARTRDPAALARLRRERADVLADRQGDAARATGELEAVLASDPDDRAALRALEKLYERQVRELDYLRTVERLADLAESDAERLMLLRRLAAEWEERRGGDGGPGGARTSGLDRAADALEQILQLAPDDPDAFRALTRVYRRAGRFLALAEAIERRRGLAVDRAESRALSAELGQVYEQELRDPARAAAAYADAESQGDESTETLGALARLNEQAGRWPEAADVLERIGRTAQDPSVRADALVRAAAIALDRQDDRATAEARYARALEIDAGHLGALVALAAMYRRQRDWLRAAKLMREAEAHTVNRIEKARLLYELGTLYEDELDDSAQATEMLARVLDVDPEHVPAAERLAGLYERTERWAALEPVLEVLARKADGEGEGAPAAGLVHARLGDAARRLGKLDKAARAYEKAFALAPEALDVLRGYGVLREERREWREAAALFEAAVSRVPQEHVAERVELYGRLARCEAEAGAREAALAHYELARELDPGSERLAEAIAALHAAGGDHAALVADKRALLALARDDEARARLAEEIGDLLAGPLRDVAEAAAAYRTSLTAVPGRRHVWHKLLELHTSAKQWTQAAEALERLAELETASPVRAKYLYAAAVIRRDELDDPAGAVTLFNRALDDAPDLTKAFDALERLLADVGAWRELARNYRRMIKRLPAEGLSDLRLRLWSGLGEVALTQLEDLEMAATALEVAVTLDDKNVQRHEQLAEVYAVAGPSHAEKAIAEHQWLIAQDPDRLSSYRALAKLYAEVGAHDKLWCVAAALTFLRKAEPELVTFYERHRPHELRAAKRPFNDDAWERVVHPDEDRFVDAIFMLLGPFVAAAAAQQHQLVGLRRKERVDVATDQRVPTRILRYVSETLELAPPDLFFKESEPQSLTLVNLHDRGVLTPALVIGKGIEQRGSEAELLFEMGKRMSFLRPERFVRSAVPSPAALDVALRAALALGGAPIGSGPHNGQVDTLAAELARVVPKPVAEQVGAVARQLVSERGDAIDMTAWMAAADLTGARVGFALTNDLAAAVRVISTEPAAASPVGVKERMRDLLAYSVSEDYFAVRKVLGLELM
jgi:tetratricopeptide (TPR) repeat protein